MALAADDSVVAQGFDYIMFATLDPGEYGSFHIDAPLSGRIDYDRVWVENWSYTTEASNHYFSATGTHTVVDPNTTRPRGRSGTSIASPHGTSESSPRCTTRQARSSGSAPST